MGGTSDGGRGWGGQDHELADPSLVEPGIPAPAPAAADDDDRDRRQAKTDDDLIDPWPEEEPAPAASARAGVEGATGPRSTWATLGSAVDLLAADLGLWLLIVAIVDLPIGALSTLVKAPNSAELLVWFLAFIGAGALSWAMGQRWLGRSPSVGEAYGAAWHKFGSLFGANLVIGLAVSLTAALGLIVASILAGAGAALPAAVVAFWTIVIMLAIVVVYCLTNQAIMLDDFGWRTGYQRSSALGRGRRWHVLRVLVVTAALSYLPWFLAVGTTAVAGLPPVVVGAVSGLGSMGAACLVTAVLTVLYVDLRATEAPAAAAAEPAEVAAAEDAQAEVAAVSMPAPEAPGESAPTLGSAVEAATLIESAPVAEAGPVAEALSPVEPDAVHAVPERSTRTRAGTLGLLAAATVALAVVFGIQVASAINPLGSNRGVLEFGLALGPDACSVGQPVTSITADQGVYTAAVLRRRVNTGEQIDIIGYHDGTEVGDAPYPVTAATDCLASTQAISGFTAGTWRFEYHVGSEVVATGTIVVH